MHGESKILRHGIKDIIPIVDVVVRDDNEKMKTEKPLTT